MNEDTLNMEIRKFLKKVGITSQREVERCVSSAIEDGSIMGNEKLSISVTLELPELGIKKKIEGTIALD